MSAQQQVTLEKNETTDVLIVGAGPTGLALAMSLARAGVRFRIIDQNTHRSDRSKALGVQAGTLEALEQTQGKALVQEFTSLGLHAQKAFIHLDQQPAIELNLSCIPSEYNYILIIPQSETERILEEELIRLGGRVERQCQLTTFSETETGINGVIQNQGATTAIQARYLVGCDGARSVVRKTLNSSFQGGTYTGDFILGDVKVNWPWEYGVIRTFITAKGVMACFPMPGDQRYRFILIPKNKTKAEIEADAKNPEISLNEFQSIAQMIAPESLTLSNADWLTRFRVHHRITDHFQKGNVFLAGDSAHIHSPSGGQGMNTGIQDALNLADKLQRVILGKESAALLNHYEKERIPVAKQVLRGTDFVFKIALLKDNFLLRFFYRFVLPHLLRSSLVQKHAVTAISEVKAARRDIERRKN